MVISVDWGTGVISVPKADTTLVDSGPPEVREYDVFNTFWKELKDLEDDRDGMPFLDAQRHNTEVTIGGVTLAHVVEVINSYTVTFEDGSYQVNLFGANHNILDVANLNTVGLRSANSAGLITTTAGGNTFPQKGVALNNFAFVLRDSTTKLPKTGVTGITGEIAKDAGSFAALTNAEVEVANGVYRVDLTSTEMNADVLTLRFAAAGIDDTLVTIVTAAA